MSSVPAPRSSRPPAAQREHGLDWLRVFAFAILIFYHSGMMFVSWDFHIKNAETSPTLEYMMLFFNRWRLPLLFFISGAGVSFSLRRRTLGAFATDRFVRLFIPLLFGMLVVVPPQIYFERLHRGQFNGSYLDFYPRVFEFVPYPRGSFSWHHLWFVAYVFVFALVALPVFAFLRSAQGRSVIGGFAHALERWRWAIYLVNVPNLVVSMTLGPRWPTTHNLIADWANLTGTFLTFLWGFVFASDVRLLDVVTRRRREFLIGAVLLNVIFFAGRATNFMAGWPIDARVVYGAFVSGYLGMTWIFALMGYARAHLKSATPALSYGTEVVYPFYIVHQTVAIAIGFYIIQTSLPLGAKLAMVTVGTLVGSLAVVEFVRRVTPLRPLFGMRMRRS